MRGLASASVVAATYAIGACGAPAPSLDTLRVELDTPTATLDTDLAGSAEDADVRLAPLLRALSCSGFLYTTLQNMVTALAPSSDGGVADGGTSGEIAIGRSHVQNFSGSVRVDAPCPGADGVVGTADDGTMSARGHIRHSVLDPVWEADFGSCTYPTECGSLFANGGLTVDFGKTIAPGTELPLQDLLLAYVGSVGVTSSAAVQGTLAGRHHEGGVDLLITTANGRTATLSVEDDGTTRLETSEGTWTCDFSVNHCALAGTSRVFDW